MIGLLFQDFIRWFDARMTSRNVLLIVDNCPAHPKNIDVKPTTIANYFRHCKIQSEEDMPFEQEIGDVEGIHKLKEVISDLYYRNAMDVE
ncbi:hypothetical protein Goshw_007216 [Gossypium schwendimanii]|uniref:DDE-1 domain-containing protein n=1 Tax=Gossypium schwendimanii TaxID=34291 RepID=A0A7J9N1G4_GOSSC|nr:hypothetical protein [Gossypium schwendimanii]